jgi:hypothetical protein
MARADRGETAGASATALRTAAPPSGGGTGKASVISHAVGSSMGDSIEGLNEPSDMVWGV